jgi:hypothetical protein
MFIFFFFLGSFLWRHNDDNRSEDFREKIQDENRAAFVSLFTPHTTQSMAQDLQTFCAQPEYFAHTMCLEKFLSFAWIFNLKNNIGRTGWNQPFFVQFGPGVFATYSWSDPDKVYLFCLYTITFHQTNHMWIYWFRLKISSDGW